MEKKKRQIAMMYSGLVVLITILVYTGTAYIELEMNPIMWNRFIRITVVYIVFFSMIIAVPVTCIIYILIKKHA